MLCVYTWGLQTPGWKNKVFFLFLWILIDGIFIFVSSSFRRVEIDFDVGFIVRPTNFSLIDTPSFVILYANMKNCDFDFFISLKHDGGIRHVRRSQTRQFIVVRSEISDLIEYQNIHFL
jgi:hypothetical protein